MKEFMLYIRNAGDAKAALSQTEHLAFVKKCEVYLGHLKAKDKLIAAQPIIREGFIVSKNENGWTSVAIDPTREVQVGYYHIKANDIDEAIAMAKEKRLKQGDMVTLTGFVTLQQLLTRGMQVTQLTHMNISAIRVALRATKNPLYVKPRR